MNDISRRYQAVRVPFDQRDPDDALAQHLLHMPWYYDLISVVAMRDRWILIIEDLEAT